MHISLQDKVPIELSSVSSVADLKHLLEATTGIPVAEQKIYQEDMLMSDTISLRDYFVHNGDVLLLRHFNLRNFCVRYSEGLIATLDLNAATTVGSLKEQLSLLTGVPENQQIISVIPSAQQLLDDDKTLGDYGVISAEALQLNVNHSATATTTGSSLTPIANIAPVDDVAPVSPAIIEQNEPIFYIYLCRENLQPIILMVRPSLTVKDLKGLVQDVALFPPVLQHLTFREK